MPNRFSGKLLSDSGNALEGVKVILKSGSFSQNTTTDKEGTFNINTPDNINSKDTTITFTKDKFTLYKVKNPQPTGIYNPPQPQINSILGGILSLKGGFEGGKYLVSSLTPDIQEQLYWELFNINAFVTSNPGIYEIVIVASESTITNYDREEFLEDGTENPNWAGPTGTFNTPSLSQKALSEKRFNSLKKYIDDFFKENGSPPPNIRSEIKVGGNKVSDQYVEIQARLTQVNCRTVEIRQAEGGPIQGDKILTKPPGATKITLDAFQLPDRFGINGKYLNYYTQSPSAGGSVMSWEFIVYLSLFGTSLLNDNTIVKKTFELESLRQILYTDVINDTIKAELAEFVKLQVDKGSPIGSANTFTKKSLDEWKKTDNKDIVDLALQFSGSNRQNPISYGFPIKREITVIKLDGIGNNSFFTLNQRKGVMPKEPSVYSINICDNRT